MSLGFAYHRLQQAKRTGIDPVTGQPAETIFKAAQLSGGGLPEIDSMQLLALLAVSKLAQTPEGIKTLERVAIKFLDGIFSATGKMAATAAGNDVTAWGTPVMLSAIFERFGLIAPGFNSQFHLGLSMIAGADFAEDVISAVTGMFSFKMTEKSENIQSISYTEKVETK